MWKSNTYFTLYTYFTAWIDGVMTYHNHRVYWNQGVVTLILGYILLRHSLELYLRLQCSNNRTYLIGQNVGKKSKSRAEKSRKVKKSQKVRKKSESQKISQEKSQKVKKLLVRQNYLSNKIIHRTKLFLGQNYFSDKIILRTKLFVGYKITDLV